MILQLTFRVSIRYYLSERFRLRFEDPGLEDMMEEEPTASTGANPTADGKLPEDEGIDMGSLPNGGAAHEAVDPTSGKVMNSGAIMTLDGKVAGDELEGDAINYQILLDKIEGLLDRLKLDA